ncbi:MAG: hypothetical protein LBK70_00080 [Clostridiales bacterium]|jgi:hypothetical protein|nr:hypothetical protein [Clostridiales bacterium]
MMIWDTFVSPQGKLERLKRALELAGVSTNFIDTNNGLISWIITLLQVVVGVATSTGVGAILLKVLDLVIAVFAPSAEDNVYILYNVFLYGSNVLYKACWIPWFGDKWGASIRVGINL